MFYSRLQKISRYTAWVYSKNAVYFNLRILNYTLFQKSKQGLLNP